jgi:putative ABC transport system permease protein
VIIRQFLIEVILLATVGGLLGVVTAVALVTLTAGFLPFIDHVNINPVILLLAILSSNLIGVVFGVWPASRAASLSPIEAMRS